MSTAAWGALALALKVIAFLGMACLIWLVMTSEASDVSKFVVVLAALVLARVMR